MQGEYKEYDTAIYDVQGSLVGSLRTNFTTDELDNLDDKDMPFYNRFWDLTKTEDFTPEMENSFFCADKCLYHYQPDTWPLFRIQPDKRDV